MSRLCNQFKALESSSYIKLKNCYNHNNKFVFIIGESAII